MTHAFALVALALLGQPQDNADKRFQAMTAQLGKASSVQLLFETKIDGFKKGSLKGSVLLAAGNKALLTLEGEVDGKPLKLTVVSDGTNQRTTAPGKEPRTRATPKTFNDTLTAALERSGVVVAALLLRLDDYEGKLRDNLGVGGFKAGKADTIDGKEAVAVEYQLTPAKGVPAQVTLWLDAKTNLPLRRVLRLQAGGQAVTFTENYPSFIVNGAVNEKLFVLTK